MTKYVNSVGGHVQKCCFSTNNKKGLIINAVGTDRLGIVSDMTKYVTDVGGNVGESQAAKLGSHFSLMMVVSVPEESTQQLKDQLQTMTDLNASVFEANVDSKESLASPQIGCTYFFKMIHWKDIDTCRINVDSQVTFLSRLFSCIRHW